MPLKVPAILLNSTSFQFVLKIENFFSASAVKTFAVSILYASSNYSALTVAIAGPSFRSMKRSNPLSLQAYMLSTGCFSISSLAYSWTIYKNHQRLLALTSSSSDPRKLLLPAYSLTSEQTYQMVVTATSALGTSSIAIAEVYVLPGVIFATIAGGHSREVSILDALTLDASSSTTDDSSTTSTGLIFSWSLLVDPLHFSESCNLSLTANSSLLFIESQSLKPERTYKFIVTVYSSDMLSNAQASAYVYPIATYAPSVLITSYFNLFNPNNKLTIFAAFSSNDSVISTWTGFEGDSSSSIHLPLLDGNITLTSPTRMFLVQNRSNLASVPFPLSFASGIFSAGRTYTFRLTVAPVGRSSSMTSTYAEIQVTAHSPPSSGSITVQPTSGYGLQTVFLISSPQWTSEPDSYPLLFEFLCLLDVTDAPLSLNSPNELSYINAQLPSGLIANEYVVTCLVRVTDIYAGLSDASTNAKVTSQISISEIKTKLGTSLDTALALFDVDAVYQIVSGISASITASNCTLAPNCTALGREQCKTTSHTCGSCLSNFVGVLGDSNVPCHRQVLKSAPNYNNCTSCTFGTCINGVCTIRHKSCLGSWTTGNTTGSSCSGHGFCQYVNLVDNSILNECLVTDTGCEAQCVCVSEYGGIDCSKTVSELNDLKNIRRRICLALQNLTAIQDASSELLLSESAVFRKIIDGSELDAGGAELCGSGVEKMALYAAAGHLDSADEAQQLIMDALSSLVKLCHDFPALSLLVQSITSSLIQGVQRGMIPGQFSTNIVSDYVRTSVRYDAFSDLHGLTWQPPASEEDLAYDVSAPSLSMPQEGLDACGLSGKYVQISLTQWIANPYRNSSMLKSSLLRYSSSARNTSFISSTNFKQNTSFDFILLFSVAQNWTNKVPGCQLLTNSQSAQCKCRALRYSPYNVTFRCWDISMLCPFAAKQNTPAVDHLPHVDYRRLDFDFQGSETSSTSYTDTTKSEDIGAFVVALGKEIPATVTRFPTIDDAWPAFGVVSGLVFMFAFGYYFLWKWDVLDRQLLIFAATNRQKREDRNSSRIMTSINDKTHKNKIDSVARLSSFKSNRNSRQLSTESDDVSMQKGNLDLKKNFAKMGLTEFTSRSVSNEAFPVSPGEASQGYTISSDILSHERSIESPDPLSDDATDFNVTALFPLGEFEKETMKFMRVHNDKENEEEESKNDVTKLSNGGNRRSFPLESNIDNSQMKSLRVESGSFHNLLPAFMASSLSQKLLQTRGVIRRFLKVLLRDQDYSIYDSLR